MPSTPAQTMDQPSQQGSSQEIRQVVNYRLRCGSGIPIPPYPFTGEAFIQYATAQQEAARVRAFLLSQYKMEEDVFGLVQFRADPHLSGDQGDVVRNSKQSAQPVPARLRVLGLSSTHISSKENVAKNGDTANTTEKAVEGNSPAVFTRQVGSHPIVSEHDPEFRDIALRLSALQKSSGINTMPNTQPRRAFRPSHMVLEEKGIISPSRRNSTRLGDRSKGFKGNGSKMPDYMNCALWLTNLPPGTTEADLVKEIQTGAVCSVHIRPPKDGHDTAAATIVFMKPSGAQGFLQQSETNGGIWISGLRIKTIYSKFGMREEYSYPEQSRVLRIEGPAGHMTQNFWEKYFKECVVYRLTHVRQMTSREAGKVVMEFGFARFDAQADAVHYAIGQEPKFRGIYKVFYAPDPCDPNPGFC